MHATGRVRPRDMLENACRIIDCRPESVKIDLCDVPASDVLSSKDTAKK